MPSDFLFLVLVSISGINALEVLCACFLKSVVILNILFTLIYPICFVLLRLLEVLSFNNLAFSVVRFNTTQFSSSFIPAVTRLWNDLPNHVVESMQLQNLSAVLIHFFLVDSFKCILVFIFGTYSKLIFFLFSLFPYWADFPVGAILVYSLCFSI